jgi:hypothetical protein
MNISFVFSNQSALDPTVDIGQLKELGSFWGGWKTWRGCQTDNVICHDMNKAQELIQRNFHTTCNFYVPNSVYVSLDRPNGVKLYEGTFVHDVDNQEDIVAMHLAVTSSDVILLVGFDFSKPVVLKDKLLEHRANNYRNLTRQVILGHPTTQWVALDQIGDFRKDLLSLDNLGQDTLTNILQT